jgi:hypothetical protein
VPAIKSPIDSDDIINSLPNWSLDFMDVHHQLLLELIDAGVYLEINPLVDLVSLKLSMIVHVSCLPLITIYCHGSGV